MEQHTVLVICATGTEVCRTHISLEHTLGSRPSLPGSGLPEESAQAPSHNHLNACTPQAPQLQSKGTFVKESSAQTVPEETPTM